jgi:alkanesulfonate monooxygenase SsuD/methylene tetrahydromethanopterin reductase-like flavin-dependent oxidoreductase (luciferase family)
MQFGVQMGPRIDEVEKRVVHAWNHGFTSAWFGDSSLLWSDCYAALALAAQAPTGMQIGTGVAVAGTRLAPVTAAAIATINQLAPNRTFLGVGTGHTAWRMLGQKPISVTEFEDFLRVVRGLLTGEDVLYTRNGRSAEIRLGLGGEGFVDLETPVPVYVAASGPRIRALAARYADGFIDGLPSGPEAVAAAMEQARADAAKAGRDLPADWAMACSPGGTVVVLDDDEDLTSERVLAEAGPQVALRLHALYTAREAGSSIVAGGNMILPEESLDTWEEYCATLDVLPPEVRHARIHAGHGVAVHPEERRFITPALTSALTLTGHPEELVERLRTLDKAGMKTLMLAPGHDDRFSSLERFSRLVMRRL